MHEQRELPEFDQLDAACANVHPSELHGQLCGLLCLDDDQDGARWLDAVYADGAGALPDREQLLTLYRATAAQIAADDYILRLLLPDDDTNISVRADSLGYWCKGLLTGLGIGQMPEMEKLTEDNREFLDDVSQIARVGLDGDQSSDEDEIAYAEIVEYLRMGLLLLSSEFIALRAERSAARRLH